VTTKSRGKSTRVTQVDQNVITFPTEQNQDYMIARHGT